MKIPRLLDFFISPNGKINPSWKEIWENAPDRSWKGLGLNKMWPYFVPAIIAIILYILN